MPAATGDKSGGRDSGFLDPGAQEHLQFSCALRATSEAITDIRPKRVVNLDMSTLHCAYGFSLLADVVRKNRVTRAF